MIGKTLNRYRIHESLGRGGMGEVWAAEDTRLGRRVALKILPPEFAADKERLGRFEREARTVAALNHPNIVTLHDIEEAEGRTYLVMELMTGPALDRLIPKGGLPEDRLLDLAVPLASAVAAAHEKGVVHRDLKPSNVMMTEDGILKVLDFGLATQAGGTAGAATQVETASTPGAVLGTVPYMSPEQAQGKAMDHRSDIFSLGVILYEMATGSRPFQGESHAEVISAILRDTPPPLSEVRPELPPRLARLVARCLEKDPRQRLQSAVDLRIELADLRQEASAPPSAVSGIDASPPPRPRLRRILAGGALLAATAFAVVLVTMLRSPPGERTPAAAAQRAGREAIVVFPFENLGAAEDDYFAAGIADEITSRLATLGSLDVISRTSAVQYDRTGKTMAQIGQDLGATYVLEGTVRWARPTGESSRVRVTPQLVHVARDAQVWSDTYDGQLDEIFAVQSDIAERVVQALDLTLGDSERRALRARPTRNLEAYQVYLRGIENHHRDYYSEENRLRTVKLFERAVEMDPEFALAWSWLSAEHSYIYHLRFDATEGRQAAARRAVDRALEIQPDLPDAHLALGLYWYRCFRDYDRALEELSVAREGLPNDSRVINAISAIQRRQGRWSESLESANRALRLDPRDPTLHWDTGATYMNLGRHEEADRCFERAISIAPDETAACALKTLNHLLTGDLEAARRTLDSAPEGRNPFLEWASFELEIVEGDYEGALRRARSFPVGVLQGPWALAPRASLEAFAHELLGNQESARQTWEEARRILEEEIRERPDDARAHSAMGLALAGLGLREEAIEAGKHAVELYPPSLDAFHGPAQLQALAEIYARVGDAEAALDLIERLLKMPAGIFVKQLEMNPRWDPLRTEPRFREMIEAGDVGDRTPRD